MSKRIVFCSDGTWEKATSDTNVYKISKTVVVNSSQVVFYDDGVGAGGTLIQKLLGGAFGTGLFQKIKEGYTQIAQVYDPGDELFIFGFSRGAYTARSLAGMIATCGLPAGPPTDQTVETAFEAYRNKDQRAALLASLKDANLFDAKISMLGVWDTVGSLGIPSVVGGVAPLLYGFLDTTLHPDVLHAYHGVAVDERRMEFPATLWTSQPAPGQVMQQVWFSGCHGDVGGGNPPDKQTGTALSDITLGWMLDKASALGLQLDAAVEARYSLPLDPKYALDNINETWTALWGFPNYRTIVSGSSISNSAIIRWQHESSYRPKNLFFTNGMPDPLYQIVTVVGQPVSAAAAVGAAVG